LGERNFYGGLLEGRFPKISRNDEPFGRSLPKSPIYQSIKFEEKLSVGTT
jgi:hypothetical protein